MNDVTRILKRFDDGDPKAAEELFLLVYEELRREARARLAHEKPGQTLQATALVHEVYARLVHGSSVQDWKNRRHFFNAAAKAMRRILVDYARHKKTIKNGGHLLRHDVDIVEPAEELSRENEQLLALDEALTRLAEDDPQKANLIQLHYFAGQTIEECASMCGIAPATVKRHLTYAKAWLRDALKD